MIEETDEWAPVEENTAMPSVHCTCSVQVDAYGIFHDRECAMWMTVEEYLGETNATAAR